MNSSAYALVLAMMFLAAIALKGNAIVLLLMALVGTIEATTLVAVGVLMQVLSSSFLPYPITCFYGVLAKSSVSGTVVQETG